MFSQATRLELIIVVAALLVLLFCSQPPQSGNAQISTDAELMPQEPTPGTEDELQDAQNLPDTTINPESHDSQSAGPASYNAMTGSASPAQPRTKRIGVVDARNANGLNYKDVMYGEVTVKWVWNGSEFVARKVCEVKEKNGVTSIWSFDEHDDIALSEVQQQPGNR